MRFDDDLKPAVWGDSPWPRAEQRIEGDPEAGHGPGAGGNSTGKDELVFRASPAMQILNIPDRRPAVTERVQAVAPPAPPSAGWRWPLALVLVAAIGTGGFLYYQHLEAQRAARTAVAAGPAVGSPAASTIGAATEAAAEAVADATAVAAAEADAGATESEDEGASGSSDDKGADHATGARASRSRARRRARGASAGKPEPAAGAAVATAATPKTDTPAPQTKVKSGKGGDLDSLIDDAIGGRRPEPAKPAATAKAEPSPTDGLPDQLNMNQIRAGMRKVTDKVQACYDKFQVEGKATVRLGISRAGKVDSAAIKGKFFGTDTGACVAKAVKTASFPGFKGKPMTITYPFILQ